MKALPQLLIMFIIGLLLDGLSKLWAESFLEPYQPVPILGEVFRLTLGYNTGVAFGLFANGGVWPMILTGLVIVGLAFWFAKGFWRGQFSPQAGWAIGLLLSGAIGNFADRLWDGRVTDFLDFGLGATRWPTFNLADSFILIGLVWLMWLESISPPHPSPLGEQVRQPDPEELMK
jgi:signal peptidase II